MIGHSIREFRHFWDRASLMSRLNLVVAGIGVLFIVSSLLGLKAEGFMLPVIFGIQTIVLVLVGSSFLLMKSAAELRASERAPQILASLPGLVKIFIPLSGIVFIGSILFAPRDPEWEGMPGLAIGIIGAAWIFFGLTAVAIRTYVEANSETVRGS
jgi:hypothetical protein